MLPGGVSQEKKPEIATPAPAPAPVAPSSSHYKDKWAVQKKHQWWHTVSRPTADTIMFQGKPSTLHPGGIRPILVRFCVTAPAYFYSLVVVAVSVFGGKAQHLAPGRHQTHLGALFCAYLRDASCVLTNIVVVLLFLDPPPKRDFCSALVLVCLFAIRRLRHW